MAFLAILNPGDEVLIPSPYWVSYPEQAKLAGATSKIIRGEESQGFKITPKQLEAAIGPKSKILILNSPQILQAMRIRPMNSRLLRMSS